MRPPRTDGLGSCFAIPRCLRRLAELRCATIGAPDAAGLALDAAVPGNRLCDRPFVFLLEKFIRHASVDDIPWQRFFPRYFSARVCRRVQAACPERLFPFHKIEALRP